MSLPSLSLGHHETANRFWSHTMSHDLGFFVRRTYRVLSQTLSLAESRSSRHRAPRSTRCSQLSARCENWRKVELIHCWHSLLSKNLYSLEIPSDRKFESFAGLWMVLALLDYWASKMPVCTPILSFLFPFEGPKRFAKVVVHWAQETCQEVQ